MSNKYQEALDYVNKSVCISLACLGIEDNKTREYLHTLQELVNKEIPMKVTNIHVDWFFCPKCQGLITHYFNFCTVRPNYCEDCGQKLDWSDE